METIKEMLHYFSKPRTILEAIGFVLTMLIVWGLLTYAGSLAVLLATGVI